MGDGVLGSSCGGTNPLGASAFFSSVAGAAAAAGSSAAARSSAGPREEDGSESWELSWRGFAGDQAAASRWRVAAEACVAMAMALKRVLARGGSSAMEVEDEME
uniref:PSAD-2 n=1 Tax=Arundo donax TaxID=35708 RepID=A0A0A9E0W8_ARUDO